jgi:hypothetical protein
VLARQKKSCAAVLFHIRNETVPSNRGALASTRQTVDHPIRGNADITP